MRMVYVAERTAVVMVMIGVAVMPVPVMCPTSVNVPPTRPIVPVPRAMPGVPSIAPEPIVDNRSEYINGLYYIGLAIHILVADNLDGNLVLLIFLNVYRGYILENVLCQNSLQYDQALITFAGLYYAQVIHLSVAVQVQITERAVRVVEHRLELFQVLSVCKQLSYHLQIESFRDVRTLGGNRYSLLCP